MYDTRILQTEMSSYQEVRELVAASAFHEWIRFANRGAWTYQPDVALRISREEQIDSQYQQPWTSAIQGSNARFGYYVYYDNSPVEYHVVVSVDDGRAHIPEPQHNGGNSYGIDEYEANLGRIITGDVETFKAYLNKTPVSVQG
jgi:hypothetical protein